MIDSTQIEAVFPENVAKCLAIVLPAIDSDGDVVVHRRPLRPTDRNYSVGVYGTLWEPDSDSQEMGSRAPSEPTLSTYQIGIQTLIKDGDSDRGLKISSVLTKRIRTVLYRNEPLRLALGQLYVQDGDSRESLRRWGIRSQRFMSNDIDRQFVTISVLDFWIETEIN